MLLGPTKLYLRDFFNYTECFHQTLCTAFYILFLLGQKKRNTSYNLYGSIEFRYNLSLDCLYFLLED